MFKGAKKGVQSPERRAGAGQGQCPGQEVPLSSSRPDWSVFMAQAERAGVNQLAQDGLRWV